MGINAVYVPNPIELFPDKGSSNERGYVLWIGRFHKAQKQYLDAVKIISKAALSVPDIKMIMVGSEFTKDAINEIKKEIKEYHLEDNIEVHDYTTDIAPYYNNARIQLITSLFEAFPMTVAEGKSFSVPQVIYDMPYLEMLKRCKGHIVVPQGDINAAASELVRLWKDDDLWEKLSNESYPSIKEFVDDDLSVYWSDIFKKLARKTPLKSSKVKEEYKFILETMLFHYLKGFEENSRSINSLRKQRDQSIAEINELKEKLNHQI